MNKPEIYIIFNHACTYFFYFSISPIFLYFLYIFFIFVLFFGLGPAQPTWAGLDPASPTQSLAQASDPAGPYKARVI